MILVDTSVWVQHLRHGSAPLAGLLQEGMVSCHPFVVGELACGNLKNREEILTLLRTLPQSTVAEEEEALGFLEEHRLAGRGLGWVDVHLLASSLLSGCPLWTRDKALQEAAGKLKTAYRS